MKLAISVPDPVFKAGEQLARQLNVSRSQLYSQALAEYLGSRGALAVTTKLNEVYVANDSAVDPALAKAQLTSIPRETW